MLTLILIKALPLLTVNAPVALPQDRIEVVYRTKGKNTHAARPWDRESLSGGKLPAIISKGKL